MSTNLKTNGILINSAVDNLTGNGTISYIQVGETVAFGDILYAKSDGKYWKANATDSSKMLAIIMALETITANSYGNVLHEGYARNDAWTLTPAGALLFVSDSTSGAWTTTAPVTVGHQVQSIGYILSATTIYFKPSLVFLPISSGASFSRWTSVGPAIASAGNIAEILDASKLRAGLPIRWQYGGNWYVPFEITDPVAGAINVVGPTLPNDSLTDVQYGSPEMVVNETYFVGGDYGSTAQSILRGLTTAKPSWWRGTAHLVAVAGTHGTDASSTQPAVQLSINGSNVFGTAASPSAASEALLSTDPIVANYTINQGGTIDINCVTLGTGTPA